MKPSWGVVSRDGIKLYSASLDTLGWMARSVHDLRRVAAVFGIARERATPRADLGGLRFGVCRTPSWHLAEPASVDALAKGAELMRRGGVEISDFALPAAFDGLVQARRLIARAEGGAAFLAEARLHGEKLHPDILAMVMERSNIDPSALRRAYDLAASCRATFDAMAAEVDAVLTLSAPGEAPFGLQSTGDSVFNEMWTLLHVPCINIPGLTSPSGMPVGLTLTAPRFADDEILSVAALVGPCLAEGKPYSDD